MKTKTINICGKAVELIYCNASERGFETISGKSITNFDRTSITDCISLALACIVAAYARKGEEEPIADRDILYEATPDETKELIIATLNLQAEWYGLPEKLAAKLKAEQEAAKENGEQEEEAEDPNA